MLEPLQPAAACDVRSRHAKGRRIMLRRFNVTYIQQRQQLLLQGFLLLTQLAPA